MLLLLWRGVRLLEVDTEGSSDASLNNLGRSRTFTGESLGTSEIRLALSSRVDLFLAGSGTSTTANLLDVLRDYQVATYGQSFTSAELALQSALAVEASGISDAEIDVLSRAVHVALQADGLADVTLERVDLKRSFSGSFTGQGISEADRLDLVRSFLGEGQGSADAAWDLFLDLDLLLDSSGSSDAEVRLSRFVALNDGTSYGFAVTEGRAPGNPRIVLISIRTSSAADIFLETVEVT